jgi:hypothetical protein
MTPKEKAEELVLKYLKMKRHKIFNGWWHKIISKQCALIAVDEVIEALHEHHWQNRLIIDYWEEVKHEIEKL